MIPLSVNFTGLTVPTLDLLYGTNARKISAPFPSHCARIQVESNEFHPKMLEKVDKWVAKNIPGKWGSYSVAEARQVVLFFDDDNDAILFKLLGGETAWKEQEEQG